ncbi:MAG: 16S rRNA (uracil(1498)-N(3))-methyltransferase [Hydrogenophaga sp.]|jgi:16S rRNA (uracil1498-N3)-methyltransferase|nr:16S rRNA (uracil(1498)-N(3))-methyltransferase [Hydrogenophaga sp.]
MPRYFCPLPLGEGAELALPAAAARHVQVLRHQPGQTITLFNGQGGQWQATILAMGRNDVQVRVDRYEPVEREPARPVHLALGMPANERMDWLVEKATELGVTSLQPLHTAHSVLRLSGERASKKQAHWQQVAVAACEQCGGNRVPMVQPVGNLASWLTEASDTHHLRCVLSLAAGSRPLAQLLRDSAPSRPILFLAGPEGGLSAAEEAHAMDAGFVPVSLGTRVLRAETAALAALALATGLN